MTGSCVCSVQQFLHKESMKDNIFTYEGVKGELVETFYKLLASGDVVSYESILTDYDGGYSGASKGLILNR